MPENLAGLWCAWSGFSDKRRNHFWTIYSNAQVDKGLAVYGCDICHCIAGKDTKFAIPQKGAAAFPQVPEVREGIVVHSVARGYLVTPW